MWQYSKCTVKIWFFGWKKLFLLSQIVLIVLQDNDMNHNNKKKETTQS